MSPLLSAGLELMLVGMGTVFSFLTLLIAATVAMSRTVQRYFPQTTPLAPTAIQQDEEIAAITAAVQHHRRR
ncbi:MAG: sodium pump decarboxylase subunit gamma [Pseudomonadales bacterium]|nr:sodium pump decarboxylase subunit gamma [Pseudomonadales bacterium]